MKIFEQIKVVDAVRVYVHKTVCLGQLVCQCVCACVVRQSLSVTSFHVCTQDRLV
uniref:Uncharacterized protein n=1 Tax=Arion vulgaris TaxID=1028688 RepID=A0A0B7BQB3_9EUPU